MLGLLAETRSLWALFMHWKPRNQDQIDRCSVGGSMPTGYFGSCWIGTIQNLGSIHCRLSSTIYRRFVFPLSTLCKFHVGILTMYNIRQGSLSQDWGKHPDATGLPCEKVPSAHTDTQEPDTLYCQILGREKVLLLTDYPACGALWYSMNRFPKKAFLSVWVEEADGPCGARALGLAYFYERPKGWCDNIVL